MKRLDIKSYTTTSYTDLVYPLWIAEHGGEPCATLAALCHFGFIEAAEALLYMTKSPLPFHKTLYWLYPDYQNIMKMSKARRERPLMFEDISSCSEEDQKDTDIRVGGLRENGVNEGITTEDLVNYMSQEDTRLEVLTVMHVVLLNAAACGRDLLKLMISKGADINICSPISVGLLNAIFYIQINSVDWEVLTWDWNEGRAKGLLDFLLANGVRMDCSRCTITQLQSAMNCALYMIEKLDGAHKSQQWWDFSYYAIDKLLE